MNKPKSILDCFMDEYDEENEPISLQDLLRDESFESAFRPEELKELIANQFDNYISLDDHVNYFQEFIVSFKVSIEKLNLEMDEYIQERTEILDEIYIDFICFMIELIERNLGISIPEFETGTMSDPDTEYLIDEIYKTFILDGRKNLMKVIATDIIKQLKSHKDPEQAAEIAKEIINDYSDKITSISVEEFLIEIGKDNLAELYEDGILAGNFFRRFSPHFDNNEDFKSEIINQIIILLYYKDEQRKILTEGAKIKNG